MKYKQLITLFFIFFTFGDFQLSAQLNSTLSFEKLTVGNGLSEGTVNEIIQDKKGFMWFGTRDGLNRYDGNHFITYHHKDNDSNTISSNIIYSVFEDAQEHLWIGMWNGLDYFDRMYHRFYHFFPGNLIGDMYQDKQENIWTVIDVTTIICIKASTKKNSRNLILDTVQIILPGKGEKRVYVDGEGNVYGASAKSLYKINLNAQTHTYSLTSVYTYQSLIPPDVREDFATHKYYLQLNNALLEFNNNRFINPRIILKASNDFYYIDNLSRLWYKTFSGHTSNAFVTQIDLPTHTVKNITSVNEEDNSLLNHIRSMRFDNAGNLWIGTDGYGILKHSNIQNRFNLNFTKNRFYGLVPVGDSSVQLDYRLRLNISNNKAFSIDTFHPTANSEFNVLVTQWINVDSLGNDWFKYKNPRELVQFNPQLNKVLKIIPANNTTDKKLLEKLHQIHIQDSIFKTTTAEFNRFFTVKNYVFMSLGDLFLSYNVQKNLFTTYPFIKVSTGNSEASIYYQDTYGFVWTNSHNSCYRFNPLNGQAIKYVFKQTINRNIKSFCDDPFQPSKYMWLGTLNGLVRLNKQTGICNNYYSKNGLPAGVVYGVLNDSLGNLWMSSNNGLYRLHLKDFSVDHFTANDGLQNDEFNTAAYAKTKNGFLVFGGLTGLNFFKPEDIKPLAPPKTIITDFRLFGKSVNFGLPNSPLKQDIIYTNSITTSYKSNVITLEFIGLDFSQKQKLQYRYKLDGYKNDWNYSGINNTATYTNLDPGNYTFVVQASNANNIWGPPNTLLHLHITPLWWQTWLFKIFVVAFAVALTYIIYQYRFHQALKVEKVRNRIASDLHDEIGSTLSTITIYSKIAQNQLASGVENQKSVKLVEKISENTNQAMEAMNDIIWSINAKNDDFDNIITRIQNYATQLLELKGYNVHFNVGENIHNLKLKMEKRRDFYLIYKEALNNIVKHANGQNVWIQLQEQKNNLIVTIQDDGKGFDENTLEQSGNGLKNMKDRAATINGKMDITSTPHEGTLLKLSFPY